LSSNGDIMAIGAFQNDGNGSRAGHTRIYKYATDSWVQLGNDIDGQVVNDKSGTSVALSSDGSVVAMGSPNSSNGGSQAGQVRVWSWDGSSWIQKGSDIDGTKAKFLFGSSLALTPDGDTFVAGGPGKEDEGLKGVVSVWSFKSDWEQVHEDIEGSDANGYFGTSVSISAHAAIIAIGASGSTNGSAYVYLDNGSKWKQKAIINGENPGDNFGKSLVLAACGPGYSLAIGAPNNSAATGQVRVYHSNDLSSWTQLGNNIDGERPGDLAGTSLQTSEDGLILAVGSAGNDEGSARVFKYVDDSMWVQVGENIIGEEDGDLLDMYLALSSDGTRVAIGAENGNLGHVHLHDSECS